ncbi:hypothetical protein VOLCADRAFT_103479 [Volvox carteri f. nagariensis]|uniref:Selenide, water dikinase n=1 Tax=Volvox carteri f. nagariensis TaxID=3068 RepID=D8TM62_VOLCA|nr:uncharacterized protein VOLCADRAFT_103479 [Volvox carteri f. nagariensis]EFJ51589.1 hypothetical protein VOLCADRAFT_103479 [Volvox carteri f. nagariensis]|eukprot:XP_002947541.1 hypothetical protein VOLCADRAFT_103479 [Volvox carteri f. nagariensis]
MQVHQWHRKFREVSASARGYATTSSAPAADGAAAEPGAQVRLTQLSHGGGCGCKIAPAKLQEILLNVQLDFGSPELLVGASTSDDAAVYRLSPTQALILTTDFFMPIVDDPGDFGRVAAANAIRQAGSAGGREGYGGVHRISRISAIDVYAMGGRPLLALSVLGMPVNKLPAGVIRRIIQGGADVCRKAGIPLAGGHSIDSPEPIFGLVVAGLAHPDHIRANSTGRPGDVLLLTKPLGVGAMTTAIKKGLLDEHGYRQVIGTMTQLNTVGAELSDDPRVHAMTDVTGFGLLGHLLEVCRGSGLHGRVAAGAVPLMGPARGLAERGVLPGAVARNWDSYGASVSLGPGVEPWLRDLLVDPQTSGGLLLAVESGAEGEVLAKDLARE